MSKHVGIGYRKDFGSAFLESDVLDPAFVEVAPENWMEMGGRLGKKLRAFSERFPMLCHGLSLSIGSLSAWPFGCSTQDARHR